jgi:hypothetical protein
MSGTGAHQFSVNLVMTNCYRTCHQFSLNLVMTNCYRTCRAIGQVRYDRSYRRHVRPFLATCPTKHTSNSQIYPQKNWQLTVHRLDSDSLLQPGQSPSDWLTQPHRAPLSQNRWLLSLQPIAHRTTSQKLKVLFPTTSLLLSPFIEPHTGRASHTSLRCSRSFVTVRPLSG